MPVFVEFDSLGRRPMGHMFQVWTTGELINNITDWLTRLLTHALTCPPSDSTSWTKLVQFSDKSISDEKLCYLIGIIKRDKTREIFWLDFNPISFNDNNTTMTNNNHHNNNHNNNNLSGIHKEHKSSTILNPVLYTLVV